MDCYQGFAELLIGAQSPDSATRKGSEAQIRKLLNQDENKFLITLVMELVSGTNEPKSIQMASILFKNALINATKDESNVDLWQRQTPQMRSQIKEALMSMLANENMTVIKAAATCVAAIAIIEIPLNMWADIIPVLQSGATSDSLQIRLASLYTLGFICEDINPECLDGQQMNHILGALLSNVFPEQIELTQIAMKAFARAAPITNSNFQIPEQKEFIMKKLFEASKINDEEILTSVMMALNDIVKVNYDYINEAYIMEIGTLTMAVINSDQEKVAQLAIEIWSSMAEVEISRNSKGIKHQGIIKNCSESLINILLQAFSKFDSSHFDENLEEIPEGHCSMTAGYTLESVARTIGDEVLNPIFNFIQPKLASSNWGDRYIAMIAFGSIIDGPSTEALFEIVGQSFEHIINMINDPVPKVRQTAAFVFYKLSEFVPTLMLGNQQFLSVFISSCLEHISEHHLISTLLIGSLKNLFVQADKHKCNSILNVYFEPIFNKLIETMYRADINQANEVQSVSDATNDITEACDHMSLLPCLKNYLLAVLNELSNSLDDNTFPLRLDKVQKENFQNFLAGLCQILLAKLKGHIDSVLTNNIVVLTGNIFNSHQKVTQGGLLLYHALIYTNEAAIECQLPQIGQFIVSAITNSEDDSCGRLACGLVSDLSNYLERNMIQYADSFMTALNEVLSKSEYSTECKLHAIIAVGDTCLAIEENFFPYLDLTMTCLFSACDFTLQQSQNYEAEELMNRLRDSIIDAFISIIHGMHNMCERGSENERKLQNFACRVLQYVDQLIQKPNLQINPEFIRNLYELYIDITEYYGQNIRGQVRQFQAPKVLKDHLNSFNFEGMDSIKERFMSSMNSIGCI